MDFNNYYGQPQPPSYEETVAAPQYTYSNTAPPPVYAKTPQPAYPTQAYNQMYPEQSNAAGPSNVGNDHIGISVLLV